MNSPKVSIIIPVYNGADYLSDAIHSALAQTYKNIEILVINDGSNDQGATEAIAQSFGDKIKYYAKKNGGVSSALNFGIQNMTGDFFSWLSHDDIYFPTKVARQIEETKKETQKNYLIYSDYFFFDKNRKPLQAVHLKQHKEKQVEFDLLCEQSLHGCSLLIPKQAFSEVGLFDESQLCTQDYNLWLRMARKYHFKHVPEILVGSRVHGEQNSRTLRHEQEILSFYTRELEHLSPSYLQNIFQDHELSQALARLSKSFTNRGFLAECSENVHRLAKETLSAQGLKNFEDEIKIVPQGQKWFNSTKPFIPFRLRSILRRLKMAQIDPKNYRQLLKKTAISVEAPH